MQSPQTYPEPLRASYGGRFSCIGTACEENCCQGWGISIGRATFDRYLTVPEIAARIGRSNTAAISSPISPRASSQISPAQPTWSQPLSQKLSSQALSSQALLPQTQSTQTPAILLRIEPTEIDHARIQLLPNGLCPFLDPDSLCGIQKQHGEGLLPEVCASYPRAQRSVFGIVERALHLSCPEAARLVLLDPHLLDVARPGNQTSDLSAHYARITSLQRDQSGGDLSRAEDCANEQSDNPPSHQLADQFTDQRADQPNLHLHIRDLILLLLTDRRYRLSQRLLLLGLFCSDLDRTGSAFSSDTSLLPSSSTGPVVNELLVRYATHFAAPARRLTLEQIEPRPAQQLATVFELLQLRVRGQAIQPRLLDCLKRFELGIGHPAEPGAEQLRRYTEAAECYYRPLMERHPYVLENYLANYVFKNRFPFGHGVPSNAVVPGRNRINEEPCHASGNETTESAGKLTSAAPALPIAQLEHLSLSVHYTLMQGLLIGLSAYHREEFGLPHVCELIQCLSKAIDHNASFLEIIERYVITRRLDNHEGIAMMVC